MRSVFVGLFGKITAGVFLAAAMVFTGCAGVEAEGPELGQVAEQLGQLPSCSAVNVAVFSQTGGADFDAAPGAGDDVFNVRVRSPRGLTAVCTTDFNGLEALAHRVGLADPVRTRDAVSSDPMPGHGTNPAASDPMPGRDSSPASSDPMPGRGSNPAASDPMPGRDANPGTATVVGHDTPSAHLYHTVLTVK
jgi:hypothetical protein